MRGLVLRRRFNIKVPRYSQMIAALTWMSHSQNLRRMAREHPIDLYMQPPVTRFRLLDYHLMDRIVRDSNRCAPPGRTKMAKWLIHAFPFPPLRETLKHHDPPAGLPSHGPHGARLQQVHPTRPHQP